MNEKTRELLATQLPVYGYAPQEDEINLIDLWITLSHYRKLFFMMASIILLLGTVYTLFVFKEKYEIVSMIQIGTVEQENNRIPLESADSLISKINHSIVPGYTVQWMSEQGRKTAFKTIISNPKGSETVVISNKIKHNERELYTDFQQGLVRIITEDHRRMIDSLQAGIISSLEIAQLKLDELQNPLTLDIKLKANEIKLEEEKNKLNKLQDDNFFGIKKDEFKNKIIAGEHKQELVKSAGNILQQQMKRIEETKELLSKSMGNLSSQIERARDNQKQAQASVTELSAMSQLLIDNEIQQNHNRLLPLEERYFVTLENDKAQLLEKIQANRLQQIEVEKQNNILKQKYDELLLDNKLQIEQQKLVIDKINLDLERIKLQHKNAISEQKQRIKEIQTRLDNYNETRSVSSPVLSLNPTGLTQMTLIVLFVVLAVFFGFTSMLVALFNDKVKQRKLELA